MKTDNMFIGIDLGTSAVKLLLVSASGEVLRRVSKKYSVFYPAPGWSEQNPSDWWEAVKQGLREISEGIDVCNVRGIGCAGQMHGLVTLDVAGDVIRPAILWNDGRTDKETSYLNNSIGKERLRSLTGNIAYAGFTAPKILWMKENEPENFSRISKIMLPKDYINYKLTGAFTCDFSDASGMLLLDVKNKCYSPEMLELCGITVSQLPKLCESSDTAGFLTEQAALETGLCAGTRVAAGAGDNAGAALGTGTVGDGRCNISLGTSGTIFVSSDTFADDPDGAIHAFAHSDGGYHLMGCMLSAASCFKWFYEEILEEPDTSRWIDSIDIERAGVNDVYFLPYLMGERSPINDTDARGMFIGMRPDTSRLDMVQAIVEGVSFALRDSLEKIRELGIDIKSSMLCGGGAGSAMFRTILTNVLNMPLNIPVAEEGPGLGAAMLAMTACGEYPDVRSCAEAICGISSTVIPDPSAASRYEKKYEIFKRFYPALKPVFKAMAARDIHSI